MPDELQEMINRGAGINVKAGAVGAAALKR